jgi:hypothetical protein
VCSKHWDCKTALWIGGQKPFDQALDSLSDKLWWLIRCSLDLLVEIRCILILEWEISADESKEDDTTTPQITQ